MPKSQKTFHYCLVLQGMGEWILIVVPIFPTNILRTRQKTSYSYESVKALPSFSEFTLRLLKGP